MKIDLPSFIPDSAACRAWHARHPKPMTANGSQWQTSPRPVKRPIGCTDPARTPAPPRSVAGGALQGPMPNRALLACDDSFQPQLCSEICSTSIVRDSGWYGLVHTFTNVTHTAEEPVDCYTFRKNQRKLKEPDQDLKSRQTSNSAGEPPRCRPWRQIAIPSQIIHYVCRLASQNSSRV